jgi:PKD repeat protein
MALVTLLVAVGALLGCGMLDPVPVAQFSWTPSDPIARTNVRFTDDSTDLGSPFSAGGVKSWDWDFGDSESSSTQNPTHAYAKGDTYDVRLTVTDASGGTSTKEKTLTVSPSLNGTWSGYIDDGANRLAMTLNLTQSGAGGIGGSLTVVVRNYTISSCILAGDQVTITCFGGLVLDGTLSSNQRSMSGWYSINGAPQWTWSVNLQ